MSFLKAMHAHHQPISDAQRILPGARWKLGIHRLAIYSERQLMYLQCHHHKWPSIPHSKENHPNNRESIVCDKQMTSVYFIATKVNRSHKKSQVLVFFTFQISNLGKWQHKPGEFFPYLHINHPKLSLHNQWNMRLGQHWSLQHSCIEY